MILFFFYCAATFEGSLQDQAKLMNEMGKITDAVIIITNQICGMEEVGCLQTNLDPSPHACLIFGTTSEPFQHKIPASLCPRFLALSIYYRLMEPGRPG